MRVRVGCALLRLSGILAGALLALSVALPWAGWQGLRTVGPGIALIGLVGLTASITGISRRGAAAAVAFGVAAMALVVWRLATPPAQALLAQVRSRGSLLLAVAGAAVVVAGGAIALQRQRLAVARPLLPASERRLALLVSWRALWTSRVLVWVAGVLGMLRLGIEPGVVPGLARPFGYLGNLLISPLSAWDSSNYLLVAQYGYAPLYWLRAFFPLYPSVIRAASWSPRSALIAGILVSLVAFLAGLYLLHRLVTLERGAELAGVAVLFVAFSPMALFFSSVYSESLFLALSVGAFYAARRGWWARAGIAAALAAATRSTGIVLVLPLLVLYLYGPREDAGPAVRRAGASQSLLTRVWPRYRPAPDLAYLLLIPLASFAVLAYSGAHGAWLMPLRAQQLHWYRQFGFLIGAVKGLIVAGQSVHQIAAGPAAHVLSLPPSGELADPMKLAAVNLTDFAFLVFGVVATVGAFRRLPAAYGVYALATIVATASTYSPAEPLFSFPRFLLVVFPCQIWLAQWAASARRRQGVVILGAALLAFFSAEFATWRWVA